MHKCDDHRTTCGFWLVVAYLTLSKFDKAEDFPPMSGSSIFPGRPCTFNTSHEVALTKQPIFIQFMFHDGLAPSSPVLPFRVLSEPQWTWGVLVAVSCACFSQHLLLHYVPHLVPAFFSWSKSTFSSIEAISYSQANRLISFWLKLQM
jgi:hypothetical protein